MGPSVVVIGNFDGVHCGHQAVLRQARALARRRGLSNITWKQGEIERVPLADASVDVALLSQALHHAADPARALAEAARIVVPGGKVLVLELRGHDQAWVRERLGDRWLGFDEVPARAAQRAGSRKVTVGAQERRPVTVIVGVGSSRCFRRSVLVEGRRPDHDTRPRRTSTPSAGRRRRQKVLTVLRAHRARRRDEDDDQRH
jgi:SAM-dependent methyltransferase